MGPGPRGGIQSGRGGGGFYLLQYFSSLKAEENEVSRSFAGRPLPPVFVQGRSPWNEVSQTKFLIS